MKIHDIFKEAFIFNEILDTTAKIEWRQEENTDYGVFNLDENEYRISLEAGTFYDFKFINVAFHIHLNGQWSTQPTLNNSAASKVLGAISNGIKNRLDLYEFDAVLFFANTLQDKRMRIYNFIAKRLVKRFGHIKENVPIGDDFGTIVFKDSLSPKIREFEDYLKSVNK